MCVCVCVCVSGLIWWMCHKLLHACMLSVCFFISCVIPCKNINTTLPLSNILNITQQVLMLPLNLLCVIYLRVLLFPLFTLWPTLLMLTECVAACYCGQLSCQHRVVWWCVRQMTEVQSHKILYLILST